jgi:CIC family chloride channel protein
VGRRVAVATFHGRREISPPRAAPSLLHRHESRSRLLPRALLVGVVAGLLAVAFRELLDRIEHARPRWIELAHAHAWLGLPATVVATALAAFAGVAIVRRFAPEAAGSGIPHLQGVLHHLLPFRVQRLIPTKFVAGLLGIGSGLAIGREGPTVQMGGATGELLGRWMRSTPRERAALACAGAGAGLAAAFNAPLAGVLFVLEELRRHFAPGVLAATFVASVTADFVTRVLCGQMPAFHVKTPPLPELSALPLFAVLGVVIGLLGVLFNRTLFAALRLFDGPKLANRAWPVLLVGASIGATQYFWPTLVGGGAPLANRALEGSLAWQIVPLLFVARLLLTSASYATGAAGGIFAPMLVLGAIVGRGVADVGRGLPMFASVTSGAGGVVGMAAFFAAVVRTPVTGTVLVLEMTESWSLMLPVLTASLVAYGVAEMLRDRPIYEGLLERQLVKAGTDRAKLEEPLLVDLDVHAGAEFDGQRVAELELPTGCLLVQIRRGLRVEVPHRDTVLHAGDRIAALVQTGESDALTRLREGFAAPTLESD